MIASARHMFILKRLNEKGVVDYKGIAAELNVSEATVRRDFEKLEKDGKLKRVQGGAIGSEPHDFDRVELTMRLKHTLNSEDKIAVAAAAAKLVKAGQSVFIDSGTTLVPLAEALSRKDGVQIVSYSTLILKELQKTDTDLVIIGGKYSRADDMFYGPVAENALKLFHFDHAFIGCSGVDSSTGTVFSTGLAEMTIKQIAMKNSEVVTLLLDSSKFQKRGLLKVAAFEDFDHIFYTAGKGYDGAELPDNFTQVRVN